MYVVTHPRVILNNHFATIDVDILENSMRIISKVKAVCAPSSKLLGPFGVELRGKLCCSGTMMYA